MTQTEQSQPLITLTMTVEQASAVKAALDLFVRLGIGQLEEVADLVRGGFIPMANVCGLHSGVRDTASVEVCDAVHEQMLRVKDLLGYQRNGSHGVGHPANHICSMRAYEVEKVLSQVIATHRNPSPAFRGVDYDGLRVRYTSDPAPTASVSNAAFLVTNSAGMAIDGRDAI